MIHDNIFQSQKIRPVGTSDIVADQQRLFALFQTVPDLPVACDETRRLNDQPRRSVQCSVQADRPASGLKNIFNRYIPKALPQILLLHHQYTARSACFSGIDIILPISTAKYSARLASALIMIQQPVYERLLLAHVMIECHLAQIVIIVLIVRFCLLKRKPI